MFGAIFCHLLDKRFYFICNGGIRMIVHQQFDCRGTHALGFLYGPAWNHLGLARGHISDVTRRFKRNNQSNLLRNSVLSNGLRSRDFRVEQYSSRFGGKHRDHIQFEVRELFSVYKCRIRFAKVLTMVECEGSDRSAPGGDLLQSAKFADRDRFHMSVVNSVGKWETRGASPIYSMTRSVNC